MLFTPLHANGYYSFPDLILIVICHYRNTLSVFSYDFFNLCNLWFPFRILSSLGMMMRIKTPLQTFHLLNQHSC
ncbi:hypothetical protein KsCSTR_41740 [Candidatus Kuenenia stuttgartiensis]|uniref:Uncharacterized protein n=1 Tax=Kuenenia stuttgartiensis TaxID=174633 RepID=Q1PXK9_KUEST|nr:hypothetical protein KsCSTR_41740 [Candidatus Kuenenia stuttgartiensis]CAJ71961.1 unknown protein [Candidatus Kuenenia stuttgartiensis]